MSALEKCLTCAQPPEAACGLVWVWAEALGQLRFIAVDFKACVLSLLLHLQRQNLGYSCRGDVTVWLFEHLDGFGEVRAAGTSMREGLRGAVDLRYSLDRGRTWHPQGQGGERSHPRLWGEGVLLCGICEIWGTIGH